MKLSIDIKILYSTILIVLMIFIGSHLNPYMLVRTNLFLNGYFVDSVTTDILQYDSFYYCRQPSLTYSCKQKFGIWYIDNVGDP